MGSYDTRGGSPLHDPSADADLFCDVCKLHADDCSCPECPKCGMSGDPACIHNHGIRDPRQDPMKGDVFFTGKSRWLVTGTKYRRQGRGGYTVYALDQLRESYWGEASISRTVFCRRVKNARIEKRADAALGASS